ncbi:hypothetical protein CRYUN_Cryun08bG0165500 [Craigia yunnanensis]
MMKTLTSSCSKAIIGNNRDRGMSCFKDLSLRTEVDLETAKTQPEEENPSKTAYVKFQLQKECSFGEHIFLVGDHPMLGLWDPESYIDEISCFILAQNIPVGVSIQFKFILKTSTGNLLWQPGPDRILKSWETENTIILCEDWEEAEHQKVIEEEPLANQNGPLLDSEMAIVAENLSLKEELVSDINLVSDTDGITSPGKDPLRALSEELATGTCAPSIEKPLAIVAENISYPTEDFIANANNGVLGVKRANYLNDEVLAISNENVLVAEDFGSISKVETVQNPTAANVELNLVTPVRQNTVKLHE